MLPGNTSSITYTQQRHGPEGNIPLGATILNHYNCGCYERRHAPAPACGTGFVVISLLATRECRPEGLTLRDGKRDARDPIPVPRQRRESPGGVGQDLRDPGTTQKRETQETQGKRWNGGKRETIPSAIRGSRRRTQPIRAGSSGPATRPHSASAAAPWIGKTFCYGDAP